MPHRLRRTVARFALLALASLAGCRDAALALGRTPVHARQNADELFTALGDRFGDVRLDPFFTAARPKFAKGALTPSRIIEDSAAWTSVGPGAVRTIELAGAPGPTKYILSGHRDAPPPRRPGDYRHMLQLRDLGEGQYEWRGRDELAVGPVRADELGDALTAIFRAVQRADAAHVRATYLASMPHTTAVLGRLFSLDSIAIIQSPDAASAVTLVISVDPKRLEAAAMPNFARYLDKYVTPARFDVVAIDDQGARWWHAHGERNRITIKLRVLDGDLVPLDATPRRIPDALRVQSDVFVKVGLFTVGMRGLVGDVTLQRAPHEKAFAVRFHKTPDWALPMMVGMMLRSPLHRPFEGEGAMMRYAVRDDSIAPTMLTRDFRLVVKESAILRFFQRLGSTSLNDFRGLAEKEANVWTGELFTALRADAQSMTRTN
ncbi:MAG: hypothetical protein M3081_06570 [Gemmatimonadota bacterium]|nr:hypothetical protein [Gemmatimonadota bacterium]